MKFLHTADWHLGQLFFENERSFEHQQFLNWLEDVISTQKIDVLLISGDVFDHANPTAVSIKQFYTFLNRVTSTNSSITIIITAGNHDSPARLEAPKPLLDSSRVIIVGTIEKDEIGNPDYSTLCFPIKNAEGEHKAYCLAIPFLRQGDYPNVQDSQNPYVEGVVQFYQRAIEYVHSVNSKNLPIVAMGHMHVTSAVLTELDVNERVIMGGIESVPVSAFAEKLAYLALGHIHKAQSIGGKEHIRYSGSPVPMSFSELNYKHRVVVFDLENQHVSNLEFVEVPVSIPLVRIPLKHEPIESVLEKLNTLPEFNEENNIKPYVEVRVLLTGPEPGLRHRVEKALENKQAKLTRIDVAYPKKESTESTTTEKLLSEWTEIKPEQLFMQVYAKKYQQEVPNELKDLFRQAVESAVMEEDV